MNFAEDVSRDTLPLLFSPFSIDRLGADKRPVSEEGNALRSVAASGGDSFSLPPNSLPIRIRGVRDGGPYALCHLRVCVFVKAAASACSVFAPGACYFVVEFFWAVSMLIPYAQCTGVSKWLLLVPGG